MGQIVASETVEEALSWIVAWCESHDHHFALVTVGNVPPGGQRFCAEVTRNHVGAVAPTISRSTLDPASALLALAASLEAS